MVGLTEIFWSELQDIHDSDNNWYGHGLTECGRTRCDSMKKKIEAGEYN